MGVLFAGLGVFASLRRFLGFRSDELKQSGIYRWTRNPQLVGYGLFLLAFTLAWPSWYTLIATLAYLPIAHMMVRTEEAHLRRAFGQAYERYCQEVPRYLGLPKRGSE